MRKKIAFLTSDDPADKRYKSGSPYFMVKALREHCGDVTLLGPVRPRWLKAEVLLSVASRRLLGKNYDYQHSALLARSYARLLEKRLATGDYDLIVAAYASTELAYLRSDRPVVYTSDITFALISDYYPEYSNLLGISRRHGNQVERMAIAKSDAVVYPTEWAAQSAIDHYRAARDKVYVLPYGANLEIIPDRDKIIQARNRRPGRCRLLFLGVDWERKGGEIALQAMAGLESLGVDASLTVCGCVPPDGAGHPRMSVIPFIDKNTALGEKRLASLFLDSDFLLFPTRSEATGRAVCEANAFGIPVIATRTGGVPYLVAEGENGFTLPYGSSGLEFARAVKRAWDDGGQYRKLCESSRSMFEKRLNWGAWAKGMNEIFETRLAI